MSLSMLDIALIVLVLVAVWAVVELALTIRSARKSIDEVVTSANETIAQIQPIIVKVDGMADELDPAVKQIPGMLEKTTVTIDSATATLDGLNAILGDVGTVTNVASNVTATVSSAATSAASGVVGVISKVAGPGKPQDQQHQLDGARDDEPAPEGGEAARRGSNYFVYESAKAAGAEKGTPTGDVCEGE